MKYRFKLLKKTVVYLDSITGETLHLSEGDKLYRSYIGTAIFAEIYECLGEVKGKTLTDAEAQIWKLIHENKLNDFEVYRVK